MKILFVAEAVKKTSGWSRYAFELAAQAVAEGHEIAFVVQQKTDAPYLQYVVLDRPLQLSSNPWRWFMNSWRLRGVIRNFQPEIVHFIVEPYAQCLPYVDRGKCTFILTVHGSYANLPATVSGAGYRRALACWNYERSLHRFNAIVAVSNFTRQVFVRAFPDCATKTLVIRAGCSFLPETREEEVEAFKKKFDLRYAQPIVLTVGDIKERKGQLDTLRGLVILRSKFPNAVYLMVGSTSDKAYVNAIKEYAALNRLTNATIIASDIYEEAELAAAYMTCDVFALNSNNIGAFFEGFGLAILEANAFGKPAVGSRNCGIEDAIVDGVSGFLCDQHDHADIARAISKAHDLEPIACRAQAEKFSWHETWQNYLRVYNRGSQ